MADDIVTINDIRACGFCVSGTKSWLKMYGLDPRRMMGPDATGIPADEFWSATGDEYARQILERKRHG